MAHGCRNHFHPWCMSHHSGLVSHVTPSCRFFLLPAISKVSPPLGVTFSRLDWLVGSIRRLPPSTFVALVFKHWPSSCVIRRVGDTRLLVLQGAGGASRAGTTSLTRTAVPFVSFRPPQPHKLVYWGHVMYNDDQETLIPYHYCHEHKSLVPDAASSDVHWHLPSNQITRNRRGRPSYHVVHTG